MQLSALRDILKKRRSTKKDLSIEAFKIGAGGCESCRVSAQSIENNESLFRTKDLCLTALAKQTMLDKAFKAIDNVPCVISKMNRIAQLEKRLSVMIKSNAPVDRQESLKKEIEECSHTLQEENVRFHGILIQPMLSLDTNEIQTFLGALRTENMPGKIIEFGTLVQSFIRLFPQKSPEVTRRFHSQMCEGPNKEEEQKLATSDSTSVSEYLQKELETIKDHLHQLSVRIPDVPVGNETVPRQRLKGPWAPRLRPVGRRRRRMVVRLSNIKENDIILQISGQQCEVDRLY